MENIKEELTLHLDSIKDIFKTDVKCIEIILTERVGDHLTKFVSQKVSKFYLKEQYNQEELVDFLEALDFEYDDYTSMTKFHGNVWYTDGTWSHYTHSEYSSWHHYACPKITHDLYDL